jgi:hypothetical protein
MSKGFKKRKDKAPEFARRKRAFDSVMAHYRSLNTIRLGAMNYGGGDAGSIYAARPKPIDYKIDCDRVFTHCLKSRSEQERFAKAYVFYDSEVPIDREIRAQSILGDQRHSLEQGVGALFVKRELYPASKYFLVIRGKKVKRQVGKSRPCPVMPVAETVDIEPIEDAIQDVVEERQLRSYEG